MEPRWTLDELAERVDAALAVDYRGQPSGRVRAVPDRRAIRWYTTIGLIDRPVAHRGRTALYGRRHLLQLVAVKRLQAGGLPLVAIQQELAGATDAQLAGVARLPADSSPPTPIPLAADGGGRPAGGRPGPSTATPVGRAAARPASAASRTAGGNARRAGFWRQPPAAALAAGAGAAAAAGADAGPGTGAGPGAYAGPGQGAGDPVRVIPGDPGGGVPTLRGVRLGDGATLLLEPGRELGPDDLGAILDAARPLLAALRDRGLGAADGALGQGPDGRPAGDTEPRREHP